MNTATLIDIGDDGMLGQCQDGRKLWLRGDGVPGDRVAFEEEGKGGMITEILEPSADRIPVKCPHADVCPGCQIQALPYERQLALKAAKIVETLKRLGGVEEVPFLGMVGSEKEMGTRNKVDLTLQGPEIGYQSRNGFVAIHTCPVGDPILQAWIPRVQAWLDRHPTHGLHRLILRTNSARDRVLVLVRGEWTGGEQEDFLQMARQEPAAAGLSIQADWKQPWKTVWGEEALEFELAGEKHRILHDRFFQVNHEVAQGMVEKALEPLGPGNGRALLDLFCGSGAFTLPARRAGFRVTGVDSKCPKGKAFHRADLRKGLPTFIKKQAWHVVLMDPPRSGMDKELTLSLRDKVKAKDLVYISCNPATLARDVQRLCDGGTYRIESVQGFDLFPQTTHVETVCHLKRSLHR